MNDLTGLGELGGKLIDAIRSTTGVLFEPRRIRRKARAEADAILILADAEVSDAELKARAWQRIKNREIRRQRNIEAIAQKAYEALPDKGSAAPVDEDWIHLFLGNCADVSDEQMQAVWARILAGEVAQPGTFSRRFLEFIKCLSRADAQAIDTFYRHVWMISQDGDPEFGYLNDNLIRMNARPQPVERYVPDPVRLHIKSLGLAHLDAGIAIDCEREIEFHYLGETFVCKDFGFVGPGIPVDALTALGEELISICKPEPAIEYRDAVVNQYQLTPKTPPLIAPGD